MLSFNFADGILIKTIKREEARKDGNGRSFDFRFANPDKRTKLQPVKHKFEIDSTHGLFIEERTLYVYLNNVNDKKDTFIEGYTIVIRGTIYSAIISRI